MKCTIDTLSYKRKEQLRYTGNATAVRNLRMEDGTWDKVGTQITLFLNEGLPPVLQRIQGAGGC